MNVNVNLDLDLILTENMTEALMTAPVQALQIRNGGDTLEHITLRICSSGEALFPLSLELDRLEAGTQTEIPLAEQLCLNQEYLQHLCHPLTTEVVATLMQAGEVIAGSAKQITLEGANYEK